MTNHDDLPITDHHDLDLLVAERPRPARTPDGGQAAARHALLVHIEQTQEPASAPAPAHRRTAPASDRFTLPATRPSRRRWATRLTAVAAAAVVALVAVNVAPSGNGDAGLAEAAVLKHLRTAASQPDDRIVFGVDPNDQQKNWIDPKTGAWRETISRDDGTVYAEVHRTEHRVGNTIHQREVSVDHDERTWSVRTIDYPAPTTPYSPDDLQTGFWSSPSKILSALNAGGVKVIARGTYKGKPAIKLHLAPYEGFDGVLWIDAKTYEPQQLTESRGGKKTGDRYWLPRTAKSLAEFDLKVPAGYTKTDH